MSVTDTGYAMPEWLARKDTDNGAWDVRNGPAQRGEAWTNQRERIMRVPFGGDETNRVIRAHEMTHARVSPELAVLGTELGISEGSIRCAEEFRVNQLVRTAGFDINFLVDGSERRAGERLAEMQDYAGLVQFIAATADTEGAKAFIRGIRNIDVDLAKSIREVEKSIVKTWKKDARRYGDAWQAKRWGNTTPVSAPAQSDKPGWTAGYLSYVIPLAQMLDLAVAALTPPAEDEFIDGDEDKGQNEETQIDRVKNAVTGRGGIWGQLLFDDEVRLTKSVKGSIGRKRVATNMGRNPRRINRMLTDPQRRVFDRTNRGTGGVVIIDQSGSMSLDIEDVEKVMEASPGCTIIGYSHRAGSVGVPNIWILAENGRRTENVRKGSGGNGVDVPAVKFAVSKARRNEPVLWVTDGMVTSSHNDQLYDNLEDDAARLVRRNGIHMVPNVNGAIEALRRVSAGESLPTKYVGRIYAAAQRLGIAVRH